MLNGVDDEFVHDEFERHCNVGGYDERIGVDDERPRPIGTARCSCNPLTKVDEILVKRKCANVVMLVELFVNGGDGRDAGSGVVELTCCGPGCVCLQMKKPRHNLQAILDAMIDFPEQQIFL